MADNTSNPPEVFPGFEMSPAPAEPTPPAPAPAPAEPTPPAPAPAPAEPTPPAPAEIFGEPSPDGGCQCEKCRTSGGRSERRGRHHKGCQCVKCRKGQPAPSPVPGGSDSPAAENVPPPNPFEAEPAPAKNFDSLACMTFDVSANTLSMVFGPEWQPQSPEERGQVVGALAAYYRTRDISDVPPGVLLAIVCTAYAAPRFTKPNTRDKLKLGWQWFKVRVAGFFGFLKRGAK